MSLCNSWFLVIFIFSLVAYISSITIKVPKCSPAATTSVFVEELNFCFRSMRLWLDAECKQLMWVSFFNMNFFACRQPEISSCSLIYCSKMPYIHKQIACNFQLNPIKLQSDKRLTLIAAILTHLSHFEASNRLPVVTDVVLILEETV